MEANDLPAAFG